MLCSAVLSNLASFVIILMRNLELVALHTLIAIKICCDCNCSVALPHGAKGWSAVCDWGISWSNSLFIFK